MTKLDGQRNHAEPEIQVDWAPAYELLVSFACFTARKMHPILELGATWARDVRERMPAEFLTEIKQRWVVDFEKGQDDLMMLLVRACPADRGSTAFLDWFGGLAAGDAYEVLGPRLPESGPGLPRDFIEWRNRVHFVLRTWDTHYFAQVDPVVFDGLAREAELLRARVGTQPAQEFVESVTNGLWFEPISAFRRITLIPQFHERPYNHDTAEHEGPVVLYPADVLPPAPGELPPSLLRLMRGLGDESRLRILRFLVEGPCSLTDLARLAGLTQPTVHHHLVQLRAGGMVRVHVMPSGPNRYSLRPHAVELMAAQLDSYLFAEKGKEPARHGLAT